MVCLLAVDHIPRDLFCATCQSVVALMQNQRDLLLHEDTGNPEPHSIFSHLSTDLCHPRNFEGHLHSAARMHVTCLNLLDHWDEVGETAEIPHENPHHVYATELLPHAKAYLEYVEEVGEEDPGSDEAALRAFHKKELKVLCTVSSYTAPCTLDDLKDEL